MRTLLLQGMALSAGNTVLTDPAQTTQQPQDLFPVWVQVICIGLVVLIALWILKNVFADFFTALFSKKVTVQATLAAKVAEQYVNKRMYIAQGGGNTGVGDGVAEKGIEYMFDFELPDGKRVVLDVPKSVYDVAVENTTGELIYKGKQFISYKARTEGTVMVDDMIDNNFVPINKKF